MEDHRRSAALPRTSTTRRFTLVELCITVGIVAILAAVAIPGWRSAILKSRRAELIPNIDGIRAHQIAYEASYDMHLVWADDVNSVVIFWMPASDATCNSLDLLTPGKDLHVWPKCTSTYTGGFFPEGATRCLYHGRIWSGVGTCDLDVNGIILTCTAVRPDWGGAIGCSPVGSETTRY